MRVCRVGVWSVCVWRCVCACVKGRCVLFVEVCLPCTRLRCISLVFAGITFNHSAENMLTINCEVLCICYPL